MLLCTMHSLTDETRCAGMFVPWCTVAEKLFLNHDNIRGGVPVNIYHLCIIFLILLIKELKN